MAGPHTLNETGQSCTFPTWPAGKRTRLTVESLDPNSTATVLVNAAAAQELVNAPPGQPKTISGDWAGVIITVTNARNDVHVPVKVWTE